MANVLSDEKRQQVVALGRLAWPLRRIEEATGVRRETASAYLKAAGVPVRPPRGWGRHPPPKPANEASTDPGSPKPANETSTDPGASNPANEVSTDLAPPTAWPPRPGRAPQASACEPYRELIEGALGRGRNAMAIWQDLVDAHGFKARYASVRRFVVTLRGARTPEAHPTIVTAPGEEAQVDYGEGPMVRHSETGKYRRTRLFVLTLGFSRKSVRLLTFRSSSRIWAELHERSFRRLGCAPRVVVLDNLREGVLEPDVYDPTINPLFRDVLKHYGAVALPCRVGHPDRKGKVESGVAHAQKTPLRGLRFETLEAAQAYLDHWEERWADTRIHGTTKRQVAAMFAEERPALLPLPAEPFRYYEFGRRTVHLDGCVEVEGARYGPPPGYIGRELDVQWDGIVVRILDPKTGQLLREHVRTRPGKPRIRREDEPKTTPESTLRLLARAALGGEHVGQVCQTIHARDGEPGVLRVLGILNLAKRLGAPAVDDACAAALEVGVPTYRFVKRYLERRPPQLGLKQVDPLIRQLTEYRDLIERITTKESA
ncbi:MAG TPA: IS21 family transposase [Anaeromyxobacteraceae bacterium]|nr:IS21 family transposase [Anaeromyxobacteraceae bacterium]